MNYDLKELLANVRTYIPDFDMGTEIMKRVRVGTEQMGEGTLEDDKTVTS